MTPFEIKSKDNSKIRFLKQLGRKKHRDETGKFLVENAVIIFDAAKAGIIFDSLFVTKNFIEKNKDKMDGMIGQVGAKDYYLIDEKINKSFSSLETAPGIAAAYQKPKNRIDYNKPVIYLNAINDPGNLGTILRSAMAFGLKNIVIDEKCADVFNSKTISAAKDAIFKLNIVFDKNRKFLADIKKMTVQGGSNSDWPIFSTRLEKSDGIEILKGKKSFCLVLGSEAHGVDKEIQAISDGFIKLGMSGEIESLNVASAAAIFFYEMYKDSLKSKA